jgi:hypothetical protein
LPLLIVSPWWHVGDLDTIQDHTHPAKCIVSGVVGVMQICATCDRQERTANGGCGQRTIVDTNEPILIHPVCISANWGLGWINYSLGGVL